MTMNALLDRIVERAAELLVARLLADGNPGNPGNPGPRPRGRPPRDGDPRPIRDADGDLHCPDCPGKVFATRSAYKWHRGKAHKEMRA